MDVVREQALDVGVAAHLVGDVRHVGTVRCQPLDHLQRLLQRHVRRVVELAQRRQDEDVEVLEQRHGLVRDGLDVGEIGDVADAVAEDRQPAVDYRYRLDAHAVDVDRLGALDRVEVEVRFHAEDREGVLEGVPEPGAEVLHGVRRGVGRDPLLLERVEAAHVVDAGGVVGVHMRIEERVDATIVAAQHLVAEIRRRVEEEGDVVDADQRGGAESSVAWVRRATDLAVAADHRHAGGGACSEEFELDHGFGLSAWAVRFAPESIVRGQRRTSNLVGSTMLHQDWRAAVSRAPVAPTRSGRRGSGTRPSMYLPGSLGHHGTEATVDRSWAARMRGRYL